MGYTAPTTRATDDLITASIWNADMVNNISFLANPPACRVYRAASQSITNATLTVVTFDTERYDTDTMHDTVTNNSRITIKTAGLYIVGCHVQFQADTDYTRLIVDILLNGATIIARENEEFNTNKANGQSFPLSTVYKFAVNDYIETRVFQQNTSAGANNVEAATNYSPEFYATWVGLG